MKPEWVDAMWKKSLKDVVKDIADTNPGQAEVARAIFQARIAAWTKALTITTGALALGTFALVLVAALD